MADLNPPKLDNESKTEAAPNTSSSVPIVEPPAAAMDVDDSHVTDALDAILGGLLPPDEDAAPDATTPIQIEQPASQNAVENTPTETKAGVSNDATAKGHTMAPTTAGQEPQDVTMGHGVEEKGDTSEQSQTGHVTTQLSAVPETAILAGAADIAPSKDNTIQPADNEDLQDVTMDQAPQQDLSIQDQHQAAAIRTATSAAEAIGQAPTNHDSIPPPAAEQVLQDVMMDQAPQEERRTHGQNQSEDTMGQATPTTTTTVKSAAEATNQTPTNHDSIPPEAAGQEGPQDVVMGQAGEEGGAAEWEADSSPYESSSSDSSDDSSDEESDGEVLGIQETAKLLLAQMIDGSDDEEDGKKAKGTSSAQVKTKNEQTEPVPPKPDITLTETDEIVLLGAVLHVVDNSVVVKGITHGKYHVLDEGSPLCKSDRTIIGVVSDVIGNVQSPMYVVRFASADDITKEGLLPGAQIHYPPQHSKFVFTEALQAIKGSDASNLHDEEVAGNEMEFSDDEKEQAYKKELKDRRRAGKGQARDGNTDGRPSSSYTRNEPTPSESASVLNYDDDEDGPYKPLARPANFGQGLPPIPPAPTGGFPSRGRGDSYGRGRGDFRGGRGHRGRGGRGGSRGGRPDGYSQPPQDRHQMSPTQQQAPTFPKPSPNPTTFPNPQTMPNPYQWYPPAPTPASYGQAALPLPPPPPPPPAAGGVNIQQFTAWAQAQAQQQQQQQRPPPPQHQHVPQHQQHQQIPNQQAYPQYPSQTPPAPYNQQAAHSPPAPYNQQAFPWAPPPPQTFPQGQTGGYNAAYYPAGNQGQHQQHPQHPTWNPTQQNEQRR